MLRRQSTASLQLQLWWFPCLYRGRVSTPLFHAAEQMTWPWGWEKTYSPIQNKRKNESRQSECESFESNQEFLVKSHNSGNWMCGLIVPSSQVTMKTAWKAMIKRNGGRRVGVFFLIFYFFSPAPYRFQEKDRTLARQSRESLKFNLPRLAEHQQHLICDHSYPSVGTNEDWGARRQRGESVALHPG